MKTKTTHKLRIIQDRDAESPRGWDNLGTMYCEHRRYNLGDEDAEDIRDDEGNLPSKGFIILPLYLYDHSGITMSTGPFSCPWDSGQVGYIYVSYERIFAEFTSWKRITKARRDKIEKILESEVEVYDQYLTGDVWGYILEKYVKPATDEPDESGDGIEDEEETEEVDSCWGFFGDDPETNGMKEHFDVPLEECDIEKEY